ncbi:MAG: PaaI family thioesterase [Pseudoxanthomonas sp.]
MTPAPPEGYAPCDLRIGFVDLIGPLQRRIVDGVEWFGLRIEPRHANRGPMAHGGLLASFADIVLGRAAMLASQPRRGCVTVNLSIDYLRSAPLGAWLETTACVERSGNSMAFLSCRILADDEVCALAHATLKYLDLPPKKPAAN